MKILLQKFHHLFLLNTYKRCRHSFHHQRTSKAFRKKNFQGKSAGSGDNFKTLDVRLHQTLNRNFEMFDSERYTHVSTIIIVEIIMSKKVICPEFYFHFIKINEDFATAFDHATWNSLSFEN